MAEAEYVVATFMYMRLLGYPAEKITILTTYNGQKALIKDVINTRCGKNPLIGHPHKVISRFCHVLNRNCFHEYFSTVFLKATVISSTKKIKNPRI